MKKYKLICSVLICLFLFCGCSQKNEYTLEEILNGFNYTKIEEGIYEKDIQGYEYYFYFDDEIVEDNYFKIKLISYDDNIYYYYNKNEVIVNDCVFNESSNGCEEKSEYLNLVKFTLEQFLSDFRIDIDDLKILRSDVNNKIIQIND